MLSNNNRLDLYRFLLPKIIEEDQKGGTQGVVVHWNDLGATWGGPPRLWNQIGLTPVIQQLFWVIERMGAEDLEALESLQSITDPDRCPERFLPILARSIGYELDESQPEALKRMAVRGIMHVFKTAGQHASFRAFYRLVGIKLINIFPLWKKILAEERGDYSRARYETSLLSDEAVGPSGQVSYVTQVAFAPVKPGTVRIAVGGVPYIRDEVLVAPSSVEDVQGVGRLISGGVHIPAVIEPSMINYASGNILLNFGAVTGGAVTISYEQIIEEWPYRATRIDIEVKIAMVGDPIPLFEADDAQRLLSRLEDCRPIHVLLRTFAVVVETEDEMSPAAMDRQGCVQQERIVIDPPGIPMGTGVPADVLPETAHYMLDQGTSGVDDLAIQADAEYHQALEDSGIGACPLDVLTIDNGTTVTYV